MQEVFKFSEEEFFEFVKIINEISGIDLSENKSTLEIKLRTFFKDKDFKDSKSYLNRLRYDRTLRQETLDFITVNETYFYRELPQLKDGISYIRSLEKTSSILSAPCASGEEVYSLAILAAMTSLKDLYITGIDINQNAIAEAKEAVYQGRSLQRLGISEKNHYFTEQDGKYQVKKEVLCPCRFELCNVFDHRFLQLGKFDVIFSRNMMIYFDHESRVNLMQRFHQISANHARLYTGNADLIPETPYWTKVFIKGGVSYYEKN